MINLNRKAVLPLYFHAMTSDAIVVKIRAGFRTSKLALKIIRLPMLYQKLLRPVLFRLPAESAHELALRALQMGYQTGIFPPEDKAQTFDAPQTPIKLFGLEFPNAVGLAAGFDKNGVAVKPLAALGFGFVEVGTVTSVPQDGNPRPRLFRLPQDRALINRLGFNNRGAVQIAQTLYQTDSTCIVGVNIGKSRTVAVEDAIPDYLASFRAVRAVADYVTINVSSPNTPNLRELQSTEALSALLGALQNENLHADAPPLPVLLKIAPDLDEEQLEELLIVAQAAQINGIVATNTTVQRSGLAVSARRIERIGAGGLSGAPLCVRATEIIARIYNLTGGKLPVIGVGGIFTAAEAWEKICAGASLVQIYTGFVYGGWTTARDIAHGLNELLNRSEFATFAEAAGSQARDSAMQQLSNQTAKC